MSLEKLKSLMPPIAGQRHTVVEWPLLEKHLGIAYPQSFKDFIGVYGSSHWFENFLPFYARPQSDTEARAFLKVVERKLERLEGQMRDEEWRTIELPVFPKKGGLFPFFTDIQGGLTCWLTDRIDPESWPLCCWRPDAPVQILENETITSLLIGFFERKPEVVGIWGDINDLSPADIRIDDCCAD